MVRAMRIFVTGASGFVGGVAARALARDHDVVAMARSEASATAVRQTGATPVACALGAVEPAHLAGADAIVHAAAFVGPWGSREDFWQANVEGTTQLLAVAKATGVRRFVHIGTEAALFAGQDMRDIDETYPYPASTPFLYSETKAEAERRVLAANDPAAGFTTVSLRPRLVWGPGDQSVLRELVQMVREGRFMWIGGGAARTSTAHIDNVVHGITLALTAGRGGEAYFLTDDEILTIREFVTRYLATQGEDPGDRSIPTWLARGAAAAVEPVWRVFGFPSDPPLTRVAACIMSAECTLRIDKARRDLGYEPVVTVDAGLAAMPRVV
jgi:nucleoside-diphosphate-sugar epimerase